MNAVNTTWNSNRQQTETRTLPVPKSCPAPTDFAFGYRYLFIEIIVGEHRTGTLSAVLQDLSPYVTHRYT